ncbi:MAG: lipopolysaccharide heptosyltransferase II [Spirochaetes bacterium]|nr:lipopolysaccharide heptosyltransferase II [Spirochaetota bacterium]
MKIIPTRAKVLVHAPNWVGDHAMAFPFYAALREIFPQSELTLIGRAWVADLAPVGFSTIIAFQGKALSAADFARLRNNNFTVGFTLSPSFRSAWLLKKLGIAKRHGFNTDMRSWLLTREKNKFRRQTYNRGEHRSLAYLRLLAPYLKAGVIAEELWEKHRNVQLTPLPIITLERKFSLKKSAARVVICPGSTAASKKYPVGHFIRAIETLTKRKPTPQLILMGAKIDQIECDTIAAHFANTQTHVVNLCAQTTLREAHALIASARAVVANDSGLSHIASLAGTPLVTFNGMGRREETSPLTPRKLLFDLQLACSPCFARTCPRKDFPLACLVGIAPDAVAAAVANIC